MRQPSGRVTYRLLETIASEAQIPVERLSWPHTGNTQVKWAARRPKAAHGPAHGGTGCHDAALRPDALGPWERRFFHLLTQGPCQRSLPSTTNRFAPLGPALPNAARPSDVLRSQVCVAAASLLSRSEGLSLPLAIVNVGGRTPD